MVWGSRAWSGAPGLGLGLPGSVWGSRAWFGPPGLGWGLPGFVWDARAWCGAAGLFLGLPGLAWGSRAWFRAPGPPGAFRCLPAPPDASRRLPAAAVWGSRAWFGPPGALPPVLASPVGSRCLPAAPGTSRRRCFPVTPVASQRVFARGRLKLHLRNTLSERNRGLVLVKSTFCLNFRPSKWSTFDLLFGAQYIPCPFPLRSYTLICAFGLRETPHFENGPFLPSTPSRRNTHFENRLSFRLRKTTTFLKTCSLAYAKRNI